WTHGRMGGPRNLNARAVFDRFAVRLRPRPSGVPGMQHRFHSACRAFRRAATFVTVSVCVWSLTSLGTAEEAAPAKRNVPKGYGTPGTSSTLAAPEGWQNAERKSIRAGEIDQLIAAELRNDKI